MIEWNGRSYRAKQVSHQSREHSWSMSKMFKERRRITDLWLVLVSATLVKQRERLIQPSHLFDIFWCFNLGFIGRSLRLLINAYRKLYTKPTLNISRAEERNKLHTRTDWDGKKYTSITLTFKTTKWMAQRSKKPISSPTYMLARGLTDLHTLGLTLDHIKIRE